MLPVFAFSVTCPWFAGNATLVAGCPSGLQHQQQLAGNLALSKLHDSCGRAQGERQLIFRIAVGFGMP